MMEKDRSAASCHASELELPGWERRRLLSHTLINLRRQRIPRQRCRNVPWPYKPLNPDAGAQRGFEGYYKAECMYGTFEAIVGPIAEQLGSPYKISRS